MQAERNPPHLDIPTFVPVERIPSCKGSRAQGYDQVISHGPALVVTTVHGGSLAPSLNSSTVFDQNGPGRFIAMATNGLRSLALGS